MYQPIPQEFIDGIRRRTPLAELVGRQVNLKPSTNGEWKGLCPFHAEKHASFYVIERKGFFYCFGCGKRGNCFDWVMETTTAQGFRQAADYLAELAGLSGAGSSGVTAKPIVRRPGDEAIAAERGRKIEHAREMWAQTQSADASSPPAIYLREGRSIRLAVPPTIRRGLIAHPHLRRDVRFPAMIAAVQIPTPDHPGRIVGVHCTYLAPDHRGKMRPPPGVDPAEWKPKIMRGACWGGAIRLTAAEPLMVLGEGIETSLAVLQALYDEELGAAHIDGEVCGVWAGLSLANLGAVVLPDQVRDVILAGDGDGKMPAVDGKQKTPDELLDAAAASKARAPTGTGDPCTRNSRRERSISHSPDT